MPARERPKRIPKPVRAKTVGSKPELAVKRDLFFTLLSDLSRAQPAKKETACNLIAEQVSKGRLSKPQNLALAFGALNAVRKDFDPRIKAAASNALLTVASKMTEPMAVSVLTSAIKNKRTPDFMRQRAANALGQIGNRNATRTLLDAFKREPNELTRLYYAEALRVINDPASHAEARSFLEKEKSGRVRYQLEYLLKKIK